MTGQPPPLQPRLGQPEQLAEREAARAQAGDEIAQYGRQRFPADIGERIGRGQVQHGMSGRRGRRPKRHAVGGEHENRSPAGVEPDAARSAPTATTVPACVTSMIVVGPLSAPYRAWHSSCGSATREGCAPMLACSTVACSSIAVSAPAGGEADGEGEALPARVVSVDSQAEGEIDSRAEGQPGGQRPGDGRAGQRGEMGEPVLLGGSDAATWPSQSRSASRPRAARSPRGSGTTESGARPSSPSSVGSAARCRRRRPAVRFRPARRQRAAAAVRSALRCPG